MKLSELEAYLKELRKNCGDVPVHMAVREYGSRELTEAELDKFLRFEEIWERGKGTRQELVIGYH